MQQKKYGLFTAITMIVGIVIGSGIFFKSDNILVYTQGNVALGILVFTLAAISIIFGGVTIGELAARTDEPGGLVTYAQQFCSDRAACGFGWFQLLLYWKVIQLARQGEITSKIRGYLVPSLAMVGSLFILWGGMQNPLFPFYAAICITFIVLSQMYFRRNIS